MTAGRAASIILADLASRMREREYSCRSVEQKQGQYDQLRLAVEPQLVSIQRQANIQAEQMRSSFAAATNAWASGDRAAAKTYSDVGHGYEREARQLNAEAQRLRDILKAALAETESLRRRCKDSSDAVKRLREELSRIEDPFRIDYSQLPVFPATQASIDRLVHAWAENYRGLFDLQADLSIVEVGAARYLFDHANTGRRAAVAGNRQPRVVVAWGVSKAPMEPRDKARMKGFPKPHAGDQKGHLFAHAAGGGLDINLVPMAKHLNQPLSGDGRRFNQMERYCRERPGTFYFIRPIYLDDSDRPAYFDIGIKMPDKMWVERFRN